MGSNGIARRDVQRLGRNSNAEMSDSVVVEEPLEIRIGNDVVGVTMRTPGQDRELALGFLYAEGLVESADEVEDISYCGRPADEGYGNGIRVSLRAGAKANADRVLASRRWLVTTSSCGVCGRRSIDDLLQRCPVLPKGPEIPASVLTACMDGLRNLQPTFSETGGLHAAGIFDAAGKPLAACEDIGRHNAVDKAVGTLLEKKLSGTVLVVSGRSSFEIVQKAGVARIPIVASVSAASSLAIDLAEATGVTLAAFVRNGSLNVYAHPSRLT